MNRIKPIIRITSFSCILLVLLYVLSYMAKPFDSNLRHIKGLYGEKNNSVDVLYVGGSASFVYYNPLKSWEDYGMVSYDYGTASVQAELYKTMIQEALKMQTPKLIIVDARAFQYRDDYKKPDEVAYRNVLTGMRFSSNKVNFINQYVDSQLHDKKLSYYFDIIKYHDNIVSGTSNNIKMMLGTYQHPYNGFHFVAKVDEIERHDFKTDEKKAVSNDTEAIMDDLLSYMNSTKIDYLFTVSPYAETKEHKMVYNYVQEKVESYGYRFIDCNENIDEMGLDFSKDLYNDTHVNIFGAEKYTDFLNKYILANYDIPNRKDDAGYAYMNSRLPGWKKQVEHTKAEINRLIEEKSK